MDVTGISDSLKALLLLCGNFGEGEASAAPPLSPGEYHRLAAALETQGVPLSDLAAGTALPDHLPPGGNRERLGQLLARGAALAFTVERWTNKGLWILGHTEADYPPRLRDRLESQAPPLLYGCGEVRLLYGGGLAVAGSRRVDEEGGRFAEEAARAAARQGMTVIHGEARGVDQRASRAALGEGGTVVGVPADSLLRIALRPEVRDALREGRMALAGPYHPEAGFTIGGAMGRNKVIYALSDFALVVSAEFEKGGTWGGAVEELRRERSVPVFVRAEEPVPRGNRELLQRGALPFPAQPWDRPLAELLTSAARARNPRLPLQDDLFAGNGAGGDDSE
ncbi:MAG: DNA-processing protein DprA [Candidatus Zixiibacteriota bacterium]|nr:MAG: DNA-processing protein DprA [candidate division Zixibacteria bacterium]